jgi:hypothetical protein
MSTGRAFVFVCVLLLEDITTEPHAQDISADILRVWLSGYILQHLCYHTRKHMPTAIVRLSCFLIATYLHVWVHYPSVECISLLHAAMNRCTHRCTPLTKLLARKPRNKQHSNSPNLVTTSDSLVTCILTTTNRNSESSSENLERTSQLKRRWNTCLDIASHWT